MSIVEIEFLREDCELLKKIKSDLANYKKIQEEAQMDNSGLYGYFKLVSFAEMYGYRFAEYEK